MDGRILTDISSTRTNILNRIGVYFPVSIIYPKYAQPKDTYFFKRIVEVH